MHRQNLCTKKAYYIRQPQYVSLSERMPPSYGMKTFLTECISYMRDSWRLAYLQA